jgi:WASH complex subunit strumpellin
VCKVLRGTGFSQKVGSKRPAKYPEEYFSRQHIPPAFVNMLISRLSSDDIYNQSREYPDPEHRSAALATQATMLYVLLYFAPSVLHQETAKMREIVDKHFPDNWIISIYMGLTVDLVDAWEPYKAARTALANTIEVGNVQRHSERHVKKVAVLEKEILSLLKEGFLHRECVPHLLPLVRLHTPFVYLAICLRMVAWDYVANSAVLVDCS